jgi:hypothetical protein
MAVAELLLRLGVALTAWLVLFAHTLWLAALGAAGCASDGAQPWLALLWWTPVTIMFAALLPLGRAVPGVARTLRLPAVVLMPLLVYALRTPWATLLDVNVGVEPLCGCSAAWTKFWSPLQLLVALVVCAAMTTLWLTSRRRIVPLRER